MDTGDISSIGIDRSKGPTLVWVPGLMHTPAHHQTTIEALRQESIPSVAVSLPNSSPEAATAKPYDDLKAVRATLTDLIENRGEDVVVIAHSYGGVPACQAVTGLERTTRLKNGQMGGVVRIIFLAALVLPEGMWTFQDLNSIPPPFAVRQGDIWNPNIPVCRDVFFEDLDAEQADHYLRELQPASHNHCTTPVRSPCFDNAKLPKTYILMLQDKALPMPAQLMMLNRVLDSSWTLYSLEGGHDPFLTRVKPLVEILKLIVASYS